MQSGEGWVARRLGDVFEIGSSKRILETEWTAGGVPFYGGKEIVKLAEFGAVVSNAYISEEKYRDYASKYDMPRQGDILITARGTIGVGYIVQEGDKFYYKDGNIISMRGKTPTNADFMLYAFRSNVTTDQLGDLTGTTVRHLPIQKAKELVLRMPSFAVQNTVAEQIRKIEQETQSLEAIYQQKLDNLAELKQAILQKAFAGELTAQPEQFLQEAVA
jgi:type I restriction enzyme S subunit